LYDFPSLRTCTVFIKFILDCVAIAWDLVAGIDGKLPRHAKSSLTNFRMCIEYESTQFDAASHRRFPGSTSQSNIIRRYLWPAVLDKSTRVCMHKAVVIT
uniref:Mitochondria-eating protein n=1 Tax=Gongylonema pulchrum TaxID=637853 RepID=A0A183DUP6_9BILA